MYRTSFTDASDCASSMRLMFAYATDMSQMLAFEASSDEGVLQKPSHILLYNRYSFFLEIIMFRVAEKTKRTQLQ